MRPLSTVSKLYMSQRTAVVNVLRATRIAARSANIRCLATPSSSKTNFKQSLANGPSLDDFISGDVVADRVVLGNTSACVAQYTKHLITLTSVQSASAFIPQDVDTYRVLIHQHQKGLAKTGPPHRMRGGAMSEYR